MSSAHLSLAKGGSPSLGSPPGPVPAVLGTGVGGSPLKVLIFQTGEGVLLGRNPPCFWGIMQGTDGPCVVASAFGSPEEGEVFLASPTPRPRSAAVLSVEAVVLGKQFCARLAFCGAGWRAVPRQRVLVPSGVGGRGFPSWLLRNWGGGISLSRGVSIPPVFMEPAAEGTDSPNRVRGHGLGPPASS